MTKLCIFVGATAGSTLVAMLADYCGIGFFGQCLWSGVGGIVGIYAGWKLARKLDE